MTKPNYYILESANDDRFPMFETDDPRRPHRAEVVSLDSPLVLRLGAPVPKKPILCDYHSMPKHVFSKRLANVIESFKPANVQLVPAVLRFEGKDHEYGLLHPSARVAGTMDMNKSRYSQPSGAILEKVALDYDRIAALPEPQRLIIPMEEKGRTIIFHETIKSALEATGGTGFRFFHVDAWSDTSAFD